MEITNLKDKILKCFSNWEIEGIDVQVQFRPDYGHNSMKDLVVSKFYVNVDRIISQREMLEKYMSSYARSGLMGIIEEDTTIFDEAVNKRNFTKDIPNSLLRYCCKMSTSQDHARQYIKISYEFSFPDDAEKILDKAYSYIYDSEFGKILEDHLTTEEV